MFEYTTKDPDRFDEKEMAQLKELAYYGRHTRITLGGKDYLLCVDEQHGGGSWSVMVTAPGGGAGLCDIVIVDELSGSTRSYGENKGRAITLISDLLSVLPPADIFISTVPDESEKLAGDDRAGVIKWLRMVSQNALRKLLSCVRKEPFP